MDHSATGGIGMTYPTVLVTPQIETQRRNDRFRYVRGGASAKQIYLFKLHPSAEIRLILLLIIGTFLHEVLKVQELEALLMARVLGSCYYSTVGRVILQPNNATVPTHAV